MSRIDHVALSVGDLEAQCRFYSQALGLQEEGRLDQPGAGLRTVLLGATDGPSIELVARAGSRPRSGCGDGGPAQFVEAAATTRGFFQWALAVDDLEATLDRLIAAGATNSTGILAARRPGIRFASINDPEGNMIELMERRVARAGPADDDSSPLDDTDQRSSAHA